ncbi:histidinol dehydrogenase [uncultured Algimonas sp.]|uniref:histidinol dehydrogenase n=1 Tax=uncultured Algimonas sp. TaxID=1547920 RepID=UPI0026121DD0|nr:histidinol dehydrogenase [uncultured Algimonas sp.]
MRRYDWTDMDADARTRALARPEGVSDPALMGRVAEILSEVKARGDAALTEYTRRFDTDAAVTLRVPDAELEAAWNALDARDQSVIEHARRNVKAFHAAQMPADVEVETEPGVVCRREVRAIESAGLYVPGGTAPLVSTLIMLATPAKVAGVRRRVVVTPPGKDGRIDPVILACAWRCKVTDVFAVGGAQAIAALAYGTETIPRCDKIFGPGNAYVAAAKALVSSAPGGPAIDMPAGPSEAMVICDEASDPAFIASDLLSQAEHDRVAQVLCVSCCPDVADAVEVELDRQLARLSRRDIAAEALSHARLIVTDERADIVDIVNRYAPEHLIVQMERPELLVPAIRHAGSIFLGPWTPESVGDYASGTNHTLPTNGAARAYSGITLDSFLKYVSVQQLSKAGLKRLGPVVERLAEMEGLDAHRNAVTLRLEALS